MHCFFEFPTPAYSEYGNSYESGKVSSSVNVWKAIRESWSAGSLEERGICNAEKTLSSSM